MAIFSRALLQVLSWVLARSPDFVGATLCQFLGGLTYRFSDRRHAILSALDHAFPERSLAWKHRICRLHCTRMFEMFLIVLVMRHWTPEERGERIRLSPGYEAFFGGLADERPSLLFLIHASNTEALGVLPSIDPDFPPSMTLYRELDHPVAETFVKESRESAGNTLCSRREGLLKAKQMLRKGRHTVGILFDQSAGFNGHLTLFFNRVASSSNLAPMLACKTGAAPTLLYVRRDGFWRGTVEAIPLPQTRSPAQLLRAAQGALERLLSEDDSQCADWFWAHKRWKGTLRKEAILRLDRFKSYLPEDVQALGLDQLPKTMRFAIRLAAEPTLLPSAQRLLGLLRDKRPDAQIWLIVPATLAPNSLPEHDQCFSLPLERPARLAVLRHIHAECFPDALFSLDPSAEAVAEAKLIACDFRGGFTYDKPARRTFHAHLQVERERYLSAPDACMIEFLKQLEMDETDTLAYFNPQTSPS